MTRHRMTQTQRVERLLRRRGDYGITLVDFLPPETADGGGPITRLGARIADLRARGVNVVTEGTRDGFAIYRLRDQRRTTAPPPGEAQSTPGQPVLEGLASSVSAIHGWEGDR